MIAFPDAQQLVVDACAALEPETVALAAAMGRVLAADIVTDEALVPFARSAMDGYAVATGDLTSLPQTLPVTGNAYAAPGTIRHVRGTAIAIATGAPVPDGTDAVIPYEDVTFADGAIRVTEAVCAGDAIFPPGEDAQAGDTLAARGTVVTAAVLALLAAAGHAQVSVHRRPVTTIICGGDELVAVDVRPGHGQVRNSNAPMLEAVLAAFGAIVRRVVTVSDDRDELASVLDDALTAGDLVITTGGASIGPRDYVKEVAEMLGVTFAFSQIGLRPAKPTAFGRRGAAFLAVLPGNPAAAYVALYELVLPAVRALCGAAEVFAPRLSVVLDGSINAKPGRHFAAFADLRATEAGLVARPLVNQCSSLTRTAAEACGFIIVPPGEETYRRGDRVPFDVVDWTKVQGAIETRAPVPVSDDARSPRPSLRSSLS